MNDQDRAKLILETVPRTMRSIRTEMRAVAGDEFTVPQYRVLARISRSPCTNGELADWMGVSAPTMSNMVDNLVARALVTRRPHGPDKRKVLLECTRSGMSRTRRIRKAVQHKLGVRIAHLPPSKRDELAKGLLILKELFS